MREMESHDRDHRSMFLLRISGLESSTDTFPCTRARRKKIEEHDMQAHYNILYASPVLKQKSNFTPAKTPHPTNPGIHLVHTIHLHRRAALCSARALTKHNLVIALLDRVVSVPDVWRMALRVVASPAVRPLILALARIAEHVVRVEAFCVCCQSEYLRD